MKRVVAVFFEGTANGGVHVRRSFIVATETVNKLLERAKANRCSLNTSGLRADPNDPEYYPLTVGKPSEQLASIDKAIMVGPIALRYGSTVCLLTAMD